MAAISGGLFGILVWAAVVLVLLAFLYEIFAVLRDTDLLLGPLSRDEARR